MLTSRQIVARLIDEGQISGEEAVELMNSIIIAEMTEAKEILDKCRKDTEPLDIPWPGSVTWTTTNANTSTISNLEDDCTISLSPLKPF